MKKTIILTFCALATACTLERQPLNGPSSSTFPASEAEALSGVYAAYKAMSFEDLQSTTFPYRIEDDATDIGTYRVGNANLLPQMNGTLTSESYPPRWTYETIYQVAGRVHQVLDNLDRLKETCDENVIAQFRAELLCIRAAMYDQACQFFGSISFVDHCLDLKNNATPLSSTTEVVTRLLQDLSDETIDALPIQWPRATYGTTRIDRVGAYALKARIALNWAQLNPDWYAEAARCAAKAIDLGDGIYGLQPLDCTYYENPEDGQPGATALFGYQGQYCKEWLWALQYNRLVGSLQPNIYRTAPRAVGGCSWHGPSQAMVDTYQCTDGLPITESPLYDWTNPRRNRDPRLDMTATMPHTRVLNVQYELDCTVDYVMDFSTNTMVPNAESSPLVSKSEYGANGSSGPGGYLWRKFHDNDFIGRISGDNTEDDLNVGIIRWAEVLLIDAEANIEMAGGNLARAKADLDAIRARVNMPPVQATDQAGLRKALRYERKVELAGEGFRWFDIRRWKSSDGKVLAVKAVNGNKYAPGFSTPENAKGYISNAKPIIDDDWIVSYSDASTWDGRSYMNLRVQEKMVFQAGRDELWPFPYKEFISNDAIPSGYNNPGYAPMTK